MKVLPLHCKRLDLHVAWRTRKMALQSSVGEGKTGRFPFNSKFRKFWLVHQMEQTISVWSDRNIRDQLEGDALWLVPLSRSVGPKCPFPFDQIVFHGTALLYPAYKNNNQTRGGLGRVCATGMYSSIGQVKFQKFQTGIFVEWKVPIVPPNTTLVLNTFRVHFFKSNMVFFEGIIIHIWETAHLPLP